MSKKSKHVSLPVLRVTRFQLYDPIVARIEYMMVDTRSDEARRDMDMVLEVMRSNKESTDKAMVELRTMIENIAVAQNGGNRAAGVGGSQEIGAESQAHRNTTTHSQGYNMATKCSKVEFPRFNGEDLRELIFKCEQFFDVDETPFDAKVRIASVHLEGKALQWHQVYMKSRLTREIPNWEDYVRALHDRFGALLYEDPMAELMNLKQTGSVKEYLDKFDELLNNVELSETYAISYFLAGLKSEIAIQVRMFKPKSLKEAISLSKLQEQSIYLANRKPYSNTSYKPHLPYQKQPPLLPTPQYKPSPPPNYSPFPNQPHPFQHQKPPSTQSITNNPMRNTSKPNGRRLSPQEMEEKRAKGLCFFCDDKYTLGHVCSKRRQLFLMEVENEDEIQEEEESELVVTNGEQEIEDSNPTDFHVSVHAMTDIHDYRTMRVTGHAGGQNIHILIDTGSTRNFLDVNTAKRLGCKVEETDLLPVSVADGNKIYSSSACKNFNWKIQGVMFMADLMLLPLGGCDMVLGIQWFIQLGDINWNFDKLTMEFMMNGKKVALRGKRPAVTKMIDHSKMKKLLQKPAQISMLHVGMITQVNSAMEKNNTNPYDPGDKLKLCSLDGVTDSPVISSGIGHLHDCSRFNPLVFFLYFIADFWSKNQLSNSDALSMKQNDNQNRTYSNLTGGVSKRRLVSLESKQDAHGHMLYWGIAHHKYR
ncbi:hypothetical protein BUALT_Bualt10G0017100 [Buddleja alternifolia]|uniref:Retrotransposon gag domain-containing protein n=1 Tax=Buddleja alternifolia TaxID=168488 RepID=A0AAV6X2I6_9LAMI|nr:hypothetical protein BUALT_Bualt10G0017100 [Buddleja alternifolia]